MTVRKISSARGDMSRKIMLRMLQERLYKINENEIIHKDHTPLHTLPLSSSPSPPLSKKAPQTNQNLWPFSVGKILAGLNCLVCIARYL